MIETWKPAASAWNVLANLAWPIPTLEILELDCNSMLLIDTQQLWRLIVPAGTMTKISQLPKEIAAHDSGIVMTAHGLFVAGGGGWGVNQVNAYLYRFLPGL
jgi:hypothetical protein